MKLVELPHFFIELYSEGVGGALRVVPGARGRGSGAV